MSKRIDIKPLPIPVSDESQQEFMERCMTALEGEFPDNEQRQAVCLRQWEEGKSMPNVEKKYFHGGSIKLDSKGEFEAVFATLNVIDKDRDVIMPGSIEGGSKVRISAYNHSSWYETLPVGKGEIYEDGAELKVRGKFFLDTSAGKDTYNTIKGLGDLTEWSFGFDRLEQEPGQLGDEPVMFLKKMKVHEVSPVLLGAGINTRTTAIKTRALSIPMTYEDVIAKLVCDGIIDRSKQGVVKGIIDELDQSFEVKRAVRRHETAVVDEKWNGAEQTRQMPNDAPATAYRNFFAWEPDGEDDKPDKSKWKFPHHMVNDGKPGAANYKACVSAIGVLNGARGGADIPENERRGVWRHVAKHIEDFGEDPPELKNTFGGGYRGHIQIASESANDIATRTEQIRVLKAKSGGDFSEERKSELRELSEVLQKSAERINAALVGNEKECDVAGLSAIALKLEVMKWE